MPPESGRHVLHRSELVACRACHGDGYSTQTASAATHDDGTVTLAAVVGWDAAQRSCANVCHARESWAAPQAQDCAACHRIPPGSGAHPRHASSRVGCDACHGADYSTSAVDGAKHRNGKVDLSSRSGFDPARRTCTSACHADRAWMPAGGDDDHVPDDFTITPEADPGPAPGTRKTGGCGNDGAPLALLGLLGLALARRRRRRAA
jgi:hypothetical protein